MPLLMRQRGQIMVDTRHQRRLSLRGRLRSRLPHQLDGTAPGAGASVRGGQRIEVSRGLGANRIEGALEFLDRQFVFALVRVEAPEMEMGNRIRRLDVQSAPVESRR